MKKHFFSILLSLLTATAMTVSAQEKNSAEQSDDAISLPEITLGAGWHSRKVARGRANNPDAIFRTDVAISYYGFRAAIAEYTDLTGFNNANHGSNAAARGRINNRRYRPEQFDYILTYGHTFDTSFSPISLAAHWEYDQYPALRKDYFYDGDKAYGHRHFHETMVHFTVSLDNVLDKENSYRLSLGADTSYHLENYNFYGLLHSTLTYKMNEKWTAGLKTALHWRSSEARSHNSNYNGHGFAFVNVEFQPFLCYAFNKYVSTTAYAAASPAIEGTTQRTWKENPNLHTVVYWCGISLNVKI